MTKSELVNAYVRGDVDRRGFIRRLTAMGVSAAAAATYAATLTRDAAAAPAHSTADFFIRAQGAADPDEMYGTAFVIESIEEAIAILDTAITAVLDTLSDILATFTADDFVSVGLEPEDFEVLQLISDQITEQLTALSTFLETLVSAPTRRTFGASGRVSFRQTAGDDLITTLQALAEELNRQVGLMAAIAPALESGEGRQLVTNISLVTARQTALVSDMAGVDPLPSVFEVPIDPESPPPSA